MGFQSFIYWWVEIRHGDSPNAQTEDEPIIDQIQYGYLLRILVTHVGKILIDGRNQPGLGASGGQRKEVLPQHETHRVILVLSFPFFKFLQRTLNTRHNTLKASTPGVIASSLALSVRVSESMSLVHFSQSCGW